MCSVYTSVQSLLSNLLEHVWQQLQPLVFLSVMLQTRHACFWPVSHFHVSIFTKLQSVTTLTQTFISVHLYVYTVFIRYSFSHRRTVHSEGSSFFEKQTYTWFIYNNEGVLNSLISMLAET